MSCVTTLEQLDSDHGATPMSYLTELDGEPSEAKRTALLFTWLCDDRHRPALYAELRQHRPVLRFASCAASADSSPWTYLITDTNAIKTALGSYSNAVYKGIGTGSFVLGMDLNPVHAAKRQALIKALRLDTGMMHKIASLSCHHALISPLKGRHFDLVKDVAEQAAVRFIAAYFGFPDSDHYLIQESLRRGFDGMIYQMFARHFLTDIAVPEASKVGMGGLTARIVQLLREGSDAPLRARIFDWLSVNPSRARTELARLAKQMGTIESRVAGAVQEYVGHIAADGLAHRTATFLNQAFNYGALRRAMPKELASVDASLRPGLEAIVNSLIAQKTALDESFVPRRWLLDGTLPPPNDTHGDYAFREPVIQKLANNPGNSTPLELAVDVIGSIAGLIGNVVAGTSIAINQYFDLKDPMFQEQVRLRATAFRPATASDFNAGLRAAVESADALVPFVKESMRLQPPAAFLPRTTLAESNLKLDNESLPAGSQIIVPLGAPTRDFTPDADTFSEAHVGLPATEYILGEPPVGTKDTHRCIGERIAIPLITHIVRSVLALPGLAPQQIDRQRTTLKKKWGYICESYPLQYDRDSCLVQRPLNVVMKVRQPTAEHAAKLKVAIKYGAPAIEKLLQGSGIVHFARFIFLNDDTQLALMTTYDGDFDTYIKHFAFAAGPLFDLIFEHIEDPPPMPVRLHAAEFVEHVRRFDLPSVANYFFSAHPTRKVR